jgi:hypothetical protein
VPVGCAVQHAAYGAEITLPVILLELCPIQLTNNNPPIENNAIRKTTPGDIPESSVSTGSSIVFELVLLFKRIYHHYSLVETDQKIAIYTTNTRKIPEFRRALTFWHLTMLARLNAVLTPSFSGTNRPKNTQN